MKVLFYSVKGGQGKTTHSISYAKYKQALYLTNDYESGTLDIYQDMFSKNQLQIIKPETTLNFSDLENIDDIVFDFGGWVDDKIEIIAKKVDIIVIPIFYQSIADLMPCIKTINSLSKYNKNIVILINNTDTKDVEELKKHLEKKFNDYKIFIINKSKYINRLANEGETIFDLLKKGGIIKFNLIRTGLIEQIKQLYNYLDNI
jgi:MinD-like ATPase involved in chromosome partitioning or flagellar assembly